MVSSEVMASSATLLTLPLPAPVQSRLVGVRVAGLGLGLEDWGTAGTGTAPPLQPKYSLL